MASRTISIRALLVAAAAVAAWLWVAKVPCPGQSGSDPSLLTLDRVLDAREFAPEDSGRGRWLPDSSGYTLFRPSSDAAGGQDLVRIDAATGRADILVPARRLVPPGATTPLRIAGYDWSPDGRRLLVRTNTRRRATSS